MGPIVSASGHSLSAVWPVDENLGTPASGDANHPRATKLMACIPPAEEYQVEQILFAEEG